MLLFQLKLQNEMCYFRIWDIETGECEGIIQDEEYLTGWGYVSSFFSY